MQDDILLKDLSEGILTLTLNRPDALNAFSVALLDTFAEAIEEARFDPEARVVIITGSAGKKPS